MKKYAKVILAFIVGINTLAFITGCQRKFRPIVIDIPPNRIGIGGELDTKQERVLYNTLNILMRRPYKDHQYAFPMGGTISHSVNVDESYSNGASLMVDPDKIK